MKFCRYFGKVGYGTGPTGASGFLLFILLMWSQHSSTLLVSRILKVVAFLVEKVDCKMRLIWFDEKGNEVKLV